MYIVVGRVTRSMQTYMTKEVDLSAKRKKKHKAERKRKAKNDDI
jgi:hypothetical protein